MEAAAGLGAPRRWSAAASCRERKPSCTNPADHRQMVGTVCAKPTAAAAADAARLAAGAQPDWDRTPADARARHPRACRRTVRGTSTRADGPRSARGRQDHPRRGRRSARGSRLLALLRAARARGLRRAAAHARADRRIQRAVAGGPRRVRLHQPVELPARDLHRPGRRRARGRQCGAGQARRADTADRGTGGRAAAAGRRAGRSPAPAARVAVQRSARS